VLWLKELRCNGHSPPVGVRPILPGYVVQLFRHSEVLLQNAEAEGKGTGGQGPKLDESFLKSLTCNFSFTAYTRAVSDL